MSGELEKAARKVSSAAAEQGCRNTGIPHEGSAAENYLVA